jgi:GNAT superfamily N-acetyltransferase
VPASFLLCEGERPMTDERTARQLELIDQFMALAAGAGIDCWLRGGWALDFLLGRMTRPHGDIDLFLWAADAARLLRVLRQHGFAQVGGPPTGQQRNLVKTGEEFHMTLLERNEVGVVTAGGRWARSPWPAGMLDGPIGRIGNVRCRVISAEAQLWAKEEVPKALGHAQREYDLADIALLREWLARDPALPVVRSFAPGDAEQVERLLHALTPARLETAASLVWRQSSEPERARRHSWVAVEGEDVVGFATAYFHWFAGEAGKGRIWVGVQADWRRRGIGSALWEAAAEHLHDARKLTVEVDDDPDGLAFIEHRGFSQYDSEVISRLDPRECRLEAKRHAGYRVVPLRAVLARERDLYDLYGAAGAMWPADPENRVTFEEWRQFILGNPLLDPEASVLVVDSDQRIASLAWLLADHGQSRAENEWTATLPELRGRGLARLAKLATIQWAAEHTIDEIVTGNDPHNLPMRELNRRLGCKELFIRRDLENPTTNDDREAQGGPTHRALDGMSLRRRPLRGGGGRNLPGDDLRTFRDAANPPLLARDRRRGRHPRRRSARCASLVRIESAFNRTRSRARRRARGTNGGGSSSCSSCGDRDRAVGALYGAATRLAGRAPGWHASPRPRARSWRPLPYRSHPYRGQALLSERQPGQPGHCRR